MKNKAKPDQFLLYTAPDGAVKVDVFVQQETVWLTQKALAELFGVKRPAINILPPTVMCNSVGAASW